MDMFNEMPRDVDADDTADVPTPEEPEAASDALSETIPTAFDSRRDSTLEDGLTQLLQSVDGLVALEQRVSELGQDLLGASPIALDSLPSPDALGIDGFVPRLMETALLIGALSRRMHLRMGVIEGALGVRAKPVSGALGAAASVSVLDATKPRAVLAGASVQPAAQNDRTSVGADMPAEIVAGALDETTTKAAAQSETTSAVIAALADMKAALAARRGASRD